MWFGLMIYITIVFSGLVDREWRTCGFIKCFHKFAFGELMMNSLTDQSGSSHGGSTPRSPFSPSSPRERHNKGLADSRFQRPLPNSSALGTFLCICLHYVIRKGLFIIWRNELFLPQIHHPLDQCSMEDTSPTRLSKWNRGDLISKPQRFQNWWNQTI